MSDHGTPWSLRETQSSPADREAFRAAGPQPACRVACGRVAGIDGGRRCPRTRASASTSVLVVACGLQRAAHHVLYTPLTRTSPVRIAVSSEDLGRSGPRCTRALRVLHGLRDRRRM